MSRRTPSRRKAPRRRRPSRTQIRRRRRRALAVLALAGGVVVYLTLRATVLAPVDTHGLRLEHVTIDSGAMRRDMGVDVVLPPEPPERRPLLVFLHGRNGSEHSYTDDEAMFGALARLGARAPAVAFPAGEHGYWHDRGEGAWGRYVVDEVIPEVVRRFALDGKRVAIGGISMGGFGAYDLALLHPGLFCAVGGHSPALWLRGADTAEGAFDDAEDFERNDVLAMTRGDSAAFRGIPIWNDAGREDPFLISDVAFDNALKAAGANLTARVWPGGHDRAYWDRHWPAYFNFYARALANCG